MRALPRLRGAPMGAVAVLAAAFAGLPGTAAAQTGCGAQYTVQTGDTLAAIADRCGTSVDALVEANEVVTNPARISVGWELTIPGARASLGPDAEVRPPVPDEAAEAALAEGTYQVEPGDSFASIATALQVPMRELMAANEDVDPFALRPGQALRLPANPGVPADSETPPAGQGAEGPAEEAAREPGPAEGTDARLDPANAAERDAQAADERQAGPGRQSEEDGAAEPLMLEGRVQTGAECPVLRTPDGDVYSLVSADYGFMPGEYVEIEGETIDMSFCMQGKATVRVTSMTAVPAPHGG